MNTPIMEFISKPISTILSEQKRVNLLKVKSITVQVQITEHFLQKKKCYNADVIIEKHIGRYYYGENSQCKKFLRQRIQWYGKLQFLS